MKCAKIVGALSVALFGREGIAPAQIADHINQNNLKIYLAETQTVLWGFLKRRLKPELLVCSDYFGPSYRSGETINGILHEDLQRTSFRDEEFDIVITNNVMEHVPNAIAAEWELMRILKPEGVYCFVIPFSETTEQDRVLAYLDDRGKVRYLAPAHYHWDPIRPKHGALVYRVFSFNDMKQRFEAMGHAFQSHRFSSTLLGDKPWAHLVRRAPALSAAAMG